MKNKLLTLIVTLFIVSSVFAAPTSLELKEESKIPNRFIMTQEEAGSIDYMPGQVVVLVSDSAKADALASKYSYLEQRDGISLKKSTSRIVRFTTDDNVNIKKLSRMLSRQDGVEWASPNTLHYVQSVPNDALFYQQWALNNDGSFPVGATTDSDIDWLEAYPYFETGNNPVIAIIDTGVDVDHEDLVDRFWVNPAEDKNGNGVADFAAWPAGDEDGVDDDSNWICQNDPLGALQNGCADDLIGFDFIFQAPANYPTCIESDCGDEDNLPEDEQGHGTSVAGAAVASTDNAVGIAGACPNCELMIVKGCFNDGSTGVCPALETAYSVFYAADAGADIISMSFGSNTNDPTLLTAIQYADAAGVIMVAAAGNDGSSATVYPAAHSEVIAVSATDDDDERASFANYGSWVDMSAPGTVIKTTGFSGGYASAGGTSYAAPIVAGAAGLLLSADPGLTAAQVKSNLLNYADVISTDQDIGPRINVYNSLCTSGLLDCTPVALPDLTIDTVVISQTPVPKPLSSIPFDFDVVNNGTENLTINYTIDPNSSDPQVWGSVFVPAGSTVMVYEFLNYAEEGVYAPEVIVDPNNLVEELDEGNNMMNSQYITVADLAPVLSAPVINSIIKYVNEPFVLEAAASDANDDPIVYTWFLDSGSGFIEVGTGLSHEFSLPIGSYTARVEASDGSNIDFVDVSISSRKKPRTSGKPLYDPEQYDDGFN